MINNSESIYNTETQSKIAGEWRGKEKSKYETLILESALIDRIHFHKFVNAALGPMVEMSREQKYAASQTFWEQFEDEN